MSYSSTHQWARARQLQGVNEALQAEPPFADYIENMRHDPQGYWHTMPGMFRVDDVLSGVQNTVLWMRWFSPKGARERYLMVERKFDDEVSWLGYLRLAEPLGNAGRMEWLQTDRRRTFHPNAGIQTTENNGWIYLADGANAWVRWSPDNPIRPVGFTAPPAPPVIVSTRNLDYAGLDMTDNLANNVERDQPRGLGVRPELLDDDGTISRPRWQYQYVVTYVNDLGQRSPASPVAIASDLNGKAGEFALDILARFGVQLHVPDAPKHVRQVELWRTKDLTDTTPVGRQPFYLLTRSYHAAAFDYVDFAPDEELGEQLDESVLGFIPHNVMASTLWQQTQLVIAQDSTTVYYSAAGFLEQFPLNNYLPIATERSGPLTSIHTAPRAVIVFAERAVFAIKGDPVNGFRVETLVVGKGSLSGRAVVELPSTGFAFLDKEGGPHVVVGSLEDDVATQVVPIDRPVQRTWRRRINREALSQARVTIDPYAQEIWWHLPEGGNQEPTFGMVWHYGIRSWSFRPDWHIGDLDYDRGYVWVGIRAPTAGNDAGICVLTPFATDRQYQAYDVAFDARYDTAWFVTDSRTLATHGRLQLLATGNAEPDLATRYDRAVTWTEQSDTQRYSIHPERDAPEWNQDVWSATETWDDYVPAFRPFSLEGWAATEHQLRVVAAATTDLRLVGIDLAVANTRVDPEYEER